MSSSAGRVLRQPPRAPALWAAAAFIVGRLITVAAGLAAWGADAVPPASGRWAAVDHGVLVGGTLGRLFDPWAAWDGMWFTAIARVGYRAPEAPAFFPLYPALVRVSAVLVRSYAAAGVIVSLVCAAAAMVVLYRMVAAHYDAGVAAWTVAFLSLCPVSFFFQAVYAESLFLLLVLGSLALAEHGRWTLACAVAGLAALTRNTGVLLCVPLFLVYADRRRWKLRGEHLEWPQDVRLAWLGLVPAGLIAYMGFLWWRVGDPLAFSTAQLAWARSFAWPFVTVWHGAKGASHALRVAAAQWPLSSSWIGPGGDGQWMFSMVLVPFVALVIAVIVLLLAWRLLPASYNAWALLVVLVPLFTPVRNIPLLSLPRFLLAAFPLFLGLALLTAQRPLLRWTLIVVSSLLLAWFSASFALFSWVA
jgi:Dolichyl-phosphate-mannose-protein mannosyltransferase